jgi:hypothetical protein
MSWLWESFHFLCLSGLTRRLCTCGNTSDVIAVFLFCSGGHLVLEWHMCIEPVGIVSKGGACLALVGVSSLPCRLPRCLLVWVYAEKWNEFLPHKLVTPWKRILFTSSVSCISWVLANILHDWAFPLLPEMWHKLQDADFCMIVCPKSEQTILFLSTTTVRALMKSVDSIGSLALSFMMTLMVRYFVSDIHKLYDCTHSCCICFSFAGTDIKVSLKFLLWNFLCNLVDIFSSG